MGQNIQLQTQIELKGINSDRLQGDQNVSLDFHHLKYIVSAQLRVLSNAAFKFIVTDF